MEGCDGEPDGSPGELTIRRYHRFAAGGSGLLWFEACAVVPEGRANPRQLWIHAGNVDSYRTLLEGALESGRASNGAEHRPICLLQLTHSGRYSVPPGGPRPQVAHHSLYLDPFARGPLEVVSDSELARLEGTYLEAARLAAAAGFDGVDIKHCHRYLGSELLASFTRDDSSYGGSFENRTRFLTNIIRKIREELPDLLVAVRLNVYDAIPYPYGWGMKAEEKSLEPDLTEPIRLARLLRELGVSVLSVSAGNPYFNPHIGRPFDLPIEAAYTPDEHPLEGVARLFHLTREIQQAVPELPCMGPGYSWLRQYLGFAGEANLRNGWATFVGVGREAFAHPEYARELLLEGVMQKQKVCITCSSCTQLMRDGTVTGCVPRDKTIYSPIFAEGRKKNPGARRMPRHVGRNLGDSKPHE
ncbi:NADH:flavin oxidoreductase [soil metagenome]